MKNSRTVFDGIVHHLIRTISNISIFLVILIFAGLIIKSSPILLTRPLTELLFSSKWMPSKMQFGLLPYIAGTFYVTALALLIAMPLCFFTSIFLSEYCHKRYKNIIKSVIDILAGIPSVVFGIWGVIIIVPFIKLVIAPAFNVSTSGYCLLSGGIVLAIMIFPTIIQLSAQVIETVPRELREASMALGTTKWETIKYVVMKKSLPGLTAAVILATSRALGETMAVLMVIGNVYKIPKSVFDPAYPLPALIANNYGEMMSVPLYDSAMMLSALILLVLVLIFNIIAKMVLIRIERNL